MANAIRDTKCILPWIHLHTHTNGNMHVCCNTNATEPLGNIVKENVVEIWNNEKYKKIRSQMINGEEPTDCKNCFDSERMGMYSKRQRENETWKHLEHLMVSDTADFAIKHLDINFNNICNFKCRYCDPSLSHSWAADYKKLNIPLVFENGVTPYADQMYEALVKNNVLDSLESVFFCGGEPLLMENHLETLLELDKKQRYDVKLLYITNLSKLSLKGHDYLEIWKKFSDVNVHVSIDCTGSKFEYIRNGSKWDTVYSNLITLFSNREIYKPKIGITVSVFNALYIVETIKALTATGIINIDDIALQIVKNPKIYSVQMLPQVLKKQITLEITELLNNNELPIFFKSRYDHFLNYMNDADTYEENKNEFIKTTQMLDSIRHESFNDTFPELAEFFDVRSNSSI